MKILVTGATGKLGTKVVNSLLKTVPASQVIVSVRHPDKAEGFKNQGVEVRQGDFDQPESLVSAFAGVDRLLIISTDGDNETRIRQHANAVAAALKAQVKFIAYTSVGNAGNNLLQLAQVHRATEAAIIKTGIPYSFLRNNWYLENETGSIQGVLAGAPWVTAAGSGKVGWAAKQDYADAVAAVLSGKGHENTIYELSGKPMTQEELAAILGNLLSKEVMVQQVDSAAYADVMKGAGLPDFVVNMLVEMQQSISKGALDIESSDFEKLLGRPTTPISKALAEIVSGIRNA